MPAVPSPVEPPTRLARRLNARDATLIVMGGVVGSGIFMNPSVVAARAHSTAAIAGAWICGGLVALLGAFIFAELARRTPQGGGLYGYLRDAYHPSVAFSYGWTALLVSQSGGMAAAAITFGAYLARVTPGHLSPAFWGVAAILVLSVVNALGVRDGGTAQNLFMYLKAAAICALIVVGLFVTHAAPASAAPLIAMAPAAALAAFAAAMIPVMFAYDGFQTAAFVDEELEDPVRTLPAGLVWGMAFVAVLYLGVTAAGLRTLGAEGLAATTAPALDIVQRGFGNIAGTLVAVAVATSTLGFLSNQILVSPRVYFAMAEDRTFFPIVAYVDPRTRAPVVAIVLQGVVGIALALWGRYDQLLNYVICIDFVYIGLAAFALVLRPHATGEPVIRVPGHPFTTWLFVLICAAIVVETLLAFPQDTLTGFAILLASLPVYFIWVSRGRRLES